MRDSGEDCDQRLRAVVGRPGDLPRPQAHRSSPPAIPPIAGRPASRRRSTPPSTSPPSGPPTMRATRRSYARAPPNRRRPLHSEVVSYFAALLTAGAPPRVARPPASAGRHDRSDRHPPAGSPA